MLELLAFAPEDGWAYVQVGHELQLVRPPYTRGMMSIVPKESVAVSLTRHGFILPPNGQEVFPDYASLLKFLNGQILAARQASDAAAIDEGAGQALLDFAPSEVLGQFLDRVRDELIPQCKWDHARRLLTSMRKLPTLRQHPELRDRTLDLLDKIDARQAKHDEMMEGAKPGVNFSKFPLAKEMYGDETIYQVSASVARLGTFQAVGS